MNNSNLKHTLCTLCVASLALLPATLTAQPNDHQPKGLERRQARPTTTADSLSYIAGMASTKGLLPYIISQCHVDTAYLADFVKGYEEALKMNSDPRYRARNAGIQMADMVLNSFLPSITNDFRKDGDKFNEPLYHEGFLAGVTSDSTLFSVNRAEEMYKAHRETAEKQEAMQHKYDNEAWLMKNKLRKDVHTTASGLQYRILQKGQGPLPQANDDVVVKYEGRTIDDKVFDSSYKRDPQTATFNCSRMIKGWAEALQMMPEGSKWELYIPHQLAYQDRRTGVVEPYSTLVFTIELMKVVKKP